MDIVKKVLGTRMIGTVIFIIISLIFLGSLPGFRNSIDELTYTEIVNTPGQPNYNDELEDGETYRLYDDPSTYEVLTAELEIRGDIAKWSFYIAVFFGALGGYDLYKDKKLTDEAQKTKEAKEKE